MGNRHQVLFPVVALLTLTALVAVEQCAEAATYDSVTLTWTAPGDDGNVGRASQYDIRYSRSGIAGTDTLTWWNQASQCSGEPVPQQAGATETFTVAGLLASTTYYFMIRTADEVPNWSGFSNVAVKTTTAAPDTIPPAAIRNLAKSDNGDFSLVLAEACGILTPEMQGKVSPISEHEVPEGGWPIILSKIEYVFRTDGGHIA
jgi:hypothetical protein